MERCSWVNEIKISFVCFGLLLSSLEILRMASCDLVSSPDFVSSEGLSSARVPVVVIDRCSDESWLLAVSANFDATHRIFVLNSPLSANEKKLFPFERERFFTGYSRGVKKSSSF